MRLPLYPHLWDGLCAVCATSIPDLKSQAYVEFEEEGGIICLFPRYMVRLIYGKQHYEKTTSVRGL
jgi:hypothetical protein